MGFVVSSCFVWDFKCGDNIGHNLRVLELLYAYFDDASPKQQRILCKPITITLISISEAVLYDFHARINGAKWEVQNLSDRVLEAITERRIDRLAKYIASAKKDDFFDVGDTNFYERLEELAVLRNRIHIQNEKNHKPRDEWEAFTPDRKKQAERVLEKVLKTMALKFPRPTQAQNYVSDFCLPWDEHLPKVSS